MDSPKPTTPIDVVQNTGHELAYGMRFLRKHGWRLLLWFFCLLLPLWGFAALVGELHEKEVFPFDAPVLNALHSIANPTLDHIFVFISKLGYAWGVIPLDVAVLLWLGWRRHFRDSLFFGLSVIGSAILNIAGKNYFARTRPDLWLSVAPETTYSFPSGHAMGSATLGVALILLCWPTRWRWPVTVAAISFVLLVGVSRVYLGVHFPSDILTGWTAAIAWVVGLHELIARKAPAPPANAAAGRDTIATSGS